MPDHGQTADYPPPAAEPPPVAAALAAARDDMERAWAAGERVPAEWYFGRHPALAADPAAALDLVFLEVVLREEAGDPVAADDFADRYPTLAGPLRRLLELDRALSQTSAPAAPHASTATGTPGPAPAPAAIGRYLVVEPLGGGGQGDVFIALHPGLGREVVVKRLRGPAGGGAADRLAAEGRVLAGLDHPNLARVYDLDEADGRPFVVMESVRGRNLADVRRTGRVTPADAARWVAGAARAAAYAHARGVLHLDIKPRNVVLEETGRPVLIDFGLARVERAYAPPPADAGVSGTLAYMAPEQARGENDKVGPAADVYGLGGVLFHLLTGADPVGGATAADLFRRARAGDWDRAALRGCGAPPALVRACERALAPDPAARFPSAAAFAAALDAAARPRRRAVTVAAAVGLVAVLLGAGVALWPRDRGAAVPPPPPAEPPAAAPVAAARPNLQFELRLYRPALKQAFNTMPLPFRVGERVRLSGLVPAGRHAAFVLATEGGTVRVLRTVGPADAPRTATFPEGDAAFAPLERPGGTHVVLLVAAAGGPVAAEALGRGGAWPRLGPGSLVRAAGGTATIEVRDREFGRAAAVDDPEGAVRDRLTRVLEGLPPGATAEGVAFAVTE